MRQWLNDNATIATIVIVVVLCLTAFVLLRRVCGSTRIIDKVWYVDLGTNELFTGRVDAAPVPSASGPDQGVRAYVYACGDCSKEADRWVAYLERYDAEARDTASQLIRGEIKDGEAYEAAYARTEEARKVRAADGGSWVNAQSDAGMSLIERATSPDRCPEGTLPIRCDVTSAQ